MAEYVETPCRTFTAGGALAQYLRVVQASGTIAAAGLTDREIGTTEWPAIASGDLVAVRLRTAQGTCKMVANQAISIDTLVYTAASGKVSDTAASTSYMIGVALSASTADGDIIEVLRHNHGIVTP